MNFYGDTTGGIILNGAKEAKRSTHSIWRNKTMTNRENADKKRTRRGAM